MVGVKTGGGVHGGGQVLVLEDVGQAQGADLEAGVQRAFARQILKHEGAEAAHGAFLDGDQRLVFARQTQDQLRVQRLGEAGVGDRDVQPPLGQPLGGVGGTATEVKINAQQLLDMPTILCGMVLVGITGAALDKAGRLLEMRATRWRQQEQL